MNLTPKEKETIKAVFSELLTIPHYKLNRLFGDVTIDKMRALCLKLRYEKYCADHGIRFEDMTEIDFLYADDEMENQK